MSREIDEMIRKYGDRKANEWFMRAEDKRYWSMTQRLVKEENEKMMTDFKKMKKAIIFSIIPLYLIAGLHIHLLLVRSLRRHQQ